MESSGEARARSDVLPGAGECDVSEVKQASGFCLRCPSAVKTGVAHHTRTRQKSSRLAPPLRRGAALTRGERLLHGADCSAWWGDRIVAPAVDAALSSRQDKESYLIF